MKLRLLAIALISLAEQTNAQEGRDSLRRVIPAAECSGIFVHTPSGWWLRIRPDGSGQLGYGAGDAVSLPAQSLSFPELHRKLAGLKFDGVGLSRDPCIAFSKRDATPADGLSASTRDHQAIKEMFQLARDRSKDFDRSERLASLWADHLPIFQPDPAFAALEGIWVYEKVISAGQTVPKATFPFAIGFEAPDRMLGKALTVDQMTGNGVDRVVLDSSKLPCHMDMSQRVQGKPQKVLAIYKLDADLLTISFFRGADGNPSSERPTGFESNAATRSEVFVLKRKRDR
jgi:uncharacterized protein (TIGR03067 family)